MKLPIASRLAPPVVRPAPRAAAPIPPAVSAAVARPVARPVSLTRPTVARPSAAVQTPAKSATGIPAEIVELTLKAETNRVLQNTAKATYEAQRKTLTAWMVAHKKKAFIVEGEIDGEIKTVSVTYEDTSKSTLDLDLLLKVTGLTITQLYAHGILSTSAKAVSDKLGATFAQQATVPGTPNMQAKLSAV